MFGHNLPGVYIAFEGLEGSGKTTQIHALSHSLTKDYPQKEIVDTREPGGTPIGEQIRGILHDTRNKGFCPVGEAYGYATDRAQLIYEVVLPALTKGGIVLCDRTFLSSLVYQGFAGGLTWETVWKINEEAVQGIIPDLFVYLRILAEEGFGRIAKDKRALDRMEQKDREYFKRCLKGYEWMATESFFADRFLIVDGTLPEETITEIIFARVSGLIEDKEKEARRELDLSAGRRK